MQETLTQEAIRTAMKNPDHLKEWMQESDRRWMVFNTKDLIDALPWPSGARALAEIIAVYRDHRMTINTGRTKVEKQLNQVTGQEVEIDVPVYKDETLEIEELDRAIRHLIRIASEKDPNWNLQNQPL